MSRSGFLILGLMLSMNSAAFGQDLLNRAAPVFTLPRYSAGTEQRFKRITSPDSLSLKQFRGKIVVLDFWNSECMPCMEEHEALSALAREFEPEGVQVIGVLFLENPKALPKFFGAHGPSYFPNVFADRRTSRSYGIRAIPVKVFIDRTGVVRHLLYGGPIRPGQFAEALALTRGCEAEAAAGKRLSC